MLSPWLPQRPAREHAGGGDNHPPPLCILSQDPSPFHQPLKGLHPYRVPQPLAQPGAPISTFLSADLNPKWKLPLEDRGAPATLGPGQRFKMNTFLTDRFFIYIFPGSFDFGAAFPGAATFPGAGTLHQWALPALVINGIPPSPWQRGDVTHGGF